MHSFRHCGGKRDVSLICLVREVLAYMQEDETCNFIQGMPWGMKFVLNSISDNLSCKLSGKDL